MKSSKNNKSAVWRRALTFLLGMAVFFACSEEGNSKGAREVNVIDTHDPADNFIPEGVDEKGIRNIRVGNLGHGLDLKNYTVKSCEQMDEFINLFNSAGNNVHSWFEERIGYYSIEFQGLGIYTNEFFEDYNLVFIPRGEGSSSIYHKVEKIDIKNNVLYVRIARGIPEENKLYIFDIANWLILIPVKKEYFNGVNVIVEFRETTELLWDTGNIQG